MKLLIFLILVLFSFLSYSHESNEKEINLSDCLVNVSYRFNYNKPISIKTPFYNEIEDLNSDFEASFKNFSDKKIGVLVKNTDFKIKAMVFKKRGIQTVYSLVDDSNVVKSYIYISLCVDD